MNTEYNSKSIIFDLTVPIDTDRSISSRHSNESDIPSTKHLNVDHINRTDHFANTSSSNAN